jgi:MFS family permease
VEFAYRSARVQGLEKDLGLEGTQFNAAVSILFCGYILGQIPSNLILSRVRPSLYLSGFVALWGAVSACTAAADNFTHLMVIRFFLGVTESPYFPGALFLLSSWYTKKVSLGPQISNPLVTDCTLAYTRNLP